MKRADGASRYTLTASNTRGCGKRLLERASDMRGKTALVRTYYADTLHVVAHAYATAAKHALVVVANKIRSFVDFVLGRNAFVCMRVAVVILRQLSQFAIAVSYAGKAGFFVIAEYKFDCLFARCDYFGGIGVYFHALAYRSRTRCNKRTGTFDFDHTDAARTFVAHVFEVAQRRDSKTGFLRGVQNPRACVDGDGDVIYLQCYLFHNFSLPHFVIAFLRQA